MMKYNKNIDFLYSKSVIKYYAKSFYLSSQFLPKRKKFGAYAVYAFCRFADNIVDNPRNRSKKEIKKELDALKEELILSFRYGESEHPALSALSKVAVEFEMPIEYPLDLIEGVKMDLNINRYNSFDDLYLFCYRVASTVGLMMTYILGFKDNETLVYAEKLGIAMQLTNILRDISEDKDQGRIYLPLDELNKYGISEYNIINENFNENFQKLMKFNVERAEKYYEDSEPGIKQLDKDSQFAIYAASKIYSGILKKIELNDYNPFVGRAFVPKSQKFAILLNEIIKTKLQLG